MKLPIDDLVDNLEHSNSWMRRMARRVLVEKSDQEDAVAPIATLATSSANIASSRLDALWTLLLIDRGARASSVLELSLIHI